jgi:hypothetical protein
MPRAKQDKPLYVILEPTTSINTDRVWDNIGRLWLGDYLVVLDRKSVLANNIETIIMVAICLKVIYQKDMNQTIWFINTTDTEVCLKILSVESGSKCRSFWFFRDCFLAAMTVVVFDAIIPMCCYLIVTFCIDITVWIIAIIVLSFSIGTLNFYFVALVLPRYCPT